MTLAPLARPSAIALIDCNNFYASCEEVFDPALAGKPVVVLSNNDGCVISRNPQARKIVPMGAPLFQYETLLGRHRTEILSSNYELYGDLSRRVSETLATFTPDIEKYSIDESFLEIAEDSNKSFDYLGREIREKVYKWTHIPVGVGFGATKTLAKIANRLAKKSAKANGVVDLYKSPHIDVALRRTDINDVWGIGRQYAKKMLSFGIKTALDLKYRNHRFIRKEFTVVGSRTLLELNGIRCLPLELAAPRRKSIACTRSFGAPVETPEKCYNAVSSFLQTAAAKLREHRLAAQSLTVFIETNRFSPDYAGASETFRSAYPSDNIFELQFWLGNCFERIYKRGLVYKKAGVILDNLIPREGVTTRMFREERLAPKVEKLQSAMDEINKKFGKGTIRLAAAQSGGWQTKTQRRSPRYTTRLDEVIKLR